VSPHYNVVLNNEHFVIVDKNALVLSVPSRLNEADSRPVLGRILEQDLGLRLFPVHRLDYEVSGLIIFAKTLKAQQSGNRWFEKKEVTKTYYAQSKSLDPQNEFMFNEEMVWKCKLLRGKKRAYESPAGKESLTIALLNKLDEDGIFHWELSPVTGRSHQLRYELFRHGHPILGDELYSSPFKCIHAGIALKSFRINFKNAIDAHEFNLPEVLEIKKLF